jgi:hypothetical protein
MLTGGTKQLGIRRTAVVIAALRAAPPSQPDTALDYVRRVIIENAERAEDIVFDTASQEQNGGILGIKAVAEQAAVSLRAVAERVATISAPRVEPVAYRWRYSERDRWQFGQLPYVPPREAFQEPLYAAPPSQPDTGVREAIKQAMQRLNKSGTGEMGLLDTIHAVHRILAAALPPDAGSRK